MTITCSKKLATAEAALQKTGQPQCERVSLYRYIAVLCDVKDKFQESETIHIMTRLESSVTATSVNKKNSTETGYTLTVNLLYISQVAMVNFIKQNNQLSGITKRFVFLKNTFLTFHTANHPV